MWNHLLFLKGDIKTISSHLYGNKIRWAKKETTDLHTFQHLYDILKEMLSSSRVCGFWAWTQLHHKPNVLLFELSKHYYVSEWNLEFAITTFSCFVCDETWESVLAFVRRGQFGHIQWVCIDASCTQVNTCCVLSGALFEERTTKDQQAQLWNRADKWISRSIIQNKSIWPADALIVPLCWRHTSLTRLKRGLEK